MGRVDYDRRLHANYARGRALTPERLARWIEVFAGHLPDRRPLTVVDVGAGVGRFTPALADAFGGPVAGVEPSARMRAVAATDAAHPAVTYLGGRAERLPLATASVDAALLFFVWHHVEDRPAAARELARVVKPGGRVLLRSQFADRMANLWWYRWFPRAEEVDRGMYETLPVVTATFEQAGFRTVTLDEVADVPTETVRGELERLKLRAVSTFEHLTDDEIEAGFRAIEEGLDREGEPDRDDIRGALLVLERA